MSYDLLLGLVPWNIHSTIPRTIRKIGTKNPFTMFAL